MTHTMTAPEDLYSTQSQGGFWGGVVFFVLTLVCFVFLGLYLSKVMSDREHLPISQVQMSGEQRYTSDGEISAALQEGEGLESLLMQDVAEVQARLESLPWVDRVSVRKVWPDALSIHVTEQQPVAVWDEQRVLNQRGELFQVPSLTPVQSLPQLVGPEGKEGEVLSGYRDFEALLAFNGFSIVYAQLSSRKSWQLSLKRGIVIELGREDAINRIQRFIHLYNELTQEQRDKIAYADLRYDTGIAIGWQEAGSEESKREDKE